MFSEEFFPTPAPVINRMLEKISQDARYFLEPSAGKGNIAERIRDSGGYHYERRRDVDCIELNTELASILTSKGFRVVGFDWLTYTGVCYYDAIVMNPPFSNGAEHLLRAWDFLHDGEIVCLLNQETLDNPHSAERQRLVSIIGGNGTTECLGDCFRHGERKSGVNVAMVYLKKQSEDDRLDLWATGTKERQANTDIGEEEFTLAIRDELGNMEHFYNESTSHMLKAFAHIRKAAIFMDANGISADGDYRQLLGLAVSNVNNARAEFSRRLRRDAWLRVFQKVQFQKWLDKKQTDAFLRDVETNSNIPFTADNIKGTLENVLLQRGKLFEQSVANVFDELTKYYHGNTSYTEGWKSNDEYKVNQKLVFPYGCQFRDDSRGGYVWRQFNLWYGSSSTVDIYNDLDRILCVLDGRNFETCTTIAQALQQRFRALGNKVKAPFDNTCESSYFEIKFWMKGTVHLKWKRIPGFMAAQARMRFTTVCPATKPTNSRRSSFNI